MPRLELNKESKDLLKKWKPTLGNADDVNIRDLVNYGGGGFQKQNLKRLINLLKKRV